jgi:hypothetical protein
MDKGTNNDLQNTTQKLKIELREQIKQWPREKGQRDKQLSSKYYTKTEDWTTRTHNKSGVNSGAPDGLADPTLLVARIV